jgi:hypothetical protein
MLTAPAENQDVAKMKDLDKGSGQVSRGDMLFEAPSSPLSPPPSSVEDLSSSPQRAPHREDFARDSSPLSSPPDSEEDFYADTNDPGHDFTPLTSAANGESMQQAKLAAIGNASTKRPISEVEEAGEDGRLAKRNPPEETAYQHDEHERIGFVMSESLAVSQNPGGIFSSGKFDTTPNNSVMSREEIMSQLGDPVTEKPVAAQCANDTSLASSSECTATRKVVGQAVDPRPMSHAAPRFFAYTRHDLSETLKAHHNTYKGSLYSRNGEALSVLLDGFESPRDYIGSRVLIGTMYVCSSCPHRTIAFWSRKSLLSVDKFFV